MFPQNKMTSPLKGLAILHLILTEPAHLLVAIGRGGGLVAIGWSGSLLPVAAIAGLPGRVVRAVHCVLVARVNVIRAGPYTGVHTTMVRPGSLHCELRCCRALSS